MGRISKYEEHGLNTVAKIAEKGDVHDRWLFNLSLAGASTNRSGSLGRVDKLVQISNSVPIVLRTFELFANWPSLRPSISWRRSRL
jgi:hypothetical protein